MRYIAFASSGSDEAWINAGRSEAVNQHTHFSCYVPRLPSGRNVLGELPVRDLKSLEK
jgi:hypothetical protein